MLRIYEPKVSQEEQTIEELLLEENPEAVLYEEFEESLIGVNRGCDLPVAVYDYWGCIDSLVTAQALEYWVAIQYLQDLIAEVKKHQPIFVQLPTLARAEA